jgi:hypothetical protein
VRAAIVFSGVGKRAEIQDGHCKVGKVQYTDEKYSNRKNEKRDRKTIMVMRERKETQMAKGI